jgi:hypothetical protein
MMNEQPYWLAVRLLAVATIKERVLPRPYNDSRLDKQVFDAVERFCHLTDVPPEVLSLAATYSIDDSDVVADWLEENGLDASRSLIRDQVYGSRARLIASITLHMFKK